MQQKGTALVLALGLVFALSACSDVENTANKVKNSATHEMQQISRTANHSTQHKDYFRNGRYWATSKGDVIPWQDNQETEWQKMGRQLQESFDQIMDTTKGAAKEAEERGKQMVDQNKVNG